MKKRIIVEEAGKRPGSVSLLLGKIIINSRLIKGLNLVVTDYSKLFFKHFFPYKINES